MSKIYFVIMNNLFDTDKEVEVRYDLKGSLYKRESISKDRQVARKDLNFLKDGVQIDLEESQYEQLCRQVSADSKFLAENSLIDYSMLLGVCSRGNHTTHQDENQVGMGNFDSFGVPNTIPINHEFHRSDKRIQEEFEELRKNNRLVYLSRDRQQIYYIEIIDFLTSYKWIKKKIEYYFKTTCISKEVSCVPPDRYSTRFIEFITKQVKKTVDQNRNIQLSTLKVKEEDNNNNNGSHQQDTLMINNPVDIRRQSEDNQMMNPFERMQSIPEEKSRIEN